MGRNDGRGWWTGSRRRRGLTAAGVLACLGTLCVTLVPASLAAPHAICSGANSPNVPCRFSTPSGNVRCLWTPHPDNVVCDVVATRRGFRLRPTGRAQAVHISLHRRGQTLPTSQEIVFPQSLSCRDTRTTMTCNQDFGLGEFRLPLARSHSS